MLTRRAAVKFAPASRANGSHVVQVSEDTILGGRVRLRQPEHGYRVNIDTLLLAAAVEAAAGARLMEAGCGVGACLLAVAAGAPDATLLGVEREANIAALAGENVAINAMQSRVKIATGDALERSANWGVFDGVFFNPPYDREGEGRAPAPERAHAYVGERGIADWVAALADRLTGGGALTLIHRAHKLPEILAALEGRLGGVEAAPLFPRAGEPAKRVLVRARKGSRAPARFWRGLVLHDDQGGKYTTQCEAILRGEAPFMWA